MGSLQLRQQKKKIKNFTDSAILIIGAGKIAGTTVKNLKKRGVHKFFVANRTYKNAVTMAHKINGIPLKISEIQTYISQVDIIISTTGADNYILTRDQIVNNGKTRKEKPLVLFDLAMPRDIDPDIKKLDNVYLFNIADLQKDINNNINKRKSEIHKAELIIREEFQNYLDWQCYLSINISIRKIIENYENIRLETLNNYKKKYNEKSLQEIDEVTRYLVNKLSQIPISSLKEFNSDCNTCTAFIPVVNRIFSIENTEPNEKYYCRYERKQSGQNTN